jgi:hypothetical protein
VSDAGGAVVVERKIVSSGLVVLVVESLVGGDVELDDGSVCA